MFPLACDVSFARRNQRQGPTPLAEVWKVRFPLRITMWLSTDCVEEGPLDLRAQS
jgi:hypothetical protein